MTQLLKWVCECESRSVVSNSLRPHALYSHETLQARILEWVAFPFSKASSQPWILYQLSYQGSPNYSKRPVISQKNNYEQDLIKSRRKYS